MCPVFGESFILILTLFVALVVLFVRILGVGGSTQILHLREDAEPREVIQENVLLFQHEVVYDG